MLENLKSIKLPGIHWGFQYCESKRIISFSHISFKYTNNERSVRMAYTKRVIFERNFDFFFLLNLLTKKRFQVKKICF